MELTTPVILSPWSAIPPAATVAPVSSKGHAAALETSGDPWVPPSRSRDGNDRNFVLVRKSSYGHRTWLRFVRSSFPRQCHTFSYLMSRMGWESRRVSTMRTIEHRTFGAVELRTAGHTYNQIATELGYANRGTVYRVVANALETQTVEAVDQLRSMEVDAWTEFRSRCGGRPWMARCHLPLRWFGASCPDATCSAWKGPARILSRTGSPGPWSSRRCPDADAALPALWCVSKRGSGVWSRTAEVPARPPYLATIG